MTMTGDNVDGRKCKLYYLTSGARAAWPATGYPANLTEITNVKGDLTLPLNRSEADGGDRGDEYDKVDLGRLQNEISFQVNVKKDAASIAAVDAFLTAVLAGTPMILAALSGDRNTTGIVGIYGDYAVTKFEEKQPGNAGRRYWDVTVKPAAGYDDPEAVEVATGAPS
jgi:hypothetical protein